MVDETVLALKGVGRGIPVLQDIKRNAEQAGVKWLALRDEMQKLVRDEGVVEVGVDGKETTVMFVDDVGGHATLLYTMVDHLGRIHDCVLARKQINKEDSIELQCGKVLDR
jgi:hypothetical protein